MLPTKRRRAATPRAPKAPTEPSAEAKLRRLHKLTKEADQMGVRPPAAVQLFMVQGVHAYALHEENLVSLVKHTDEATAARARGTSGRRRLTINAGTPSAKNPLAGAGFHRVLSFHATDCELHEKRWYEPKPLNFELSRHPYCSEADVLARYVGWKALLTPGGGSHFLVYFLNMGDLNLLDTPVESEEFAPFQEQRDLIESNLRKLLLVFPKRVEPRLSHTLAPVVIGKGVDYDAPYAVACFASILSDKREGQPGATSGASIGGYHERCRLWPLPTKVLQKIRQTMEHYGIDIPELRHPLAGTLQLEDARNAAISDIGPPPMQLTAELGLNPTWLARRATMPFCKPWVQVCNFNNPNGEVDNDGQPVLVPLYKGCAEERNGHCWLDPDALDVTLPHGQHVQEAMSNLVGRAYKPPPAHTEAVVRELQESLGATRAEITRLEKRCETYELTLESTQNAHDQLRHRYDKVAKTLDVSVQQHATGGKVVLGGVDARVSILRKARGTIQLTKPNGECLATWPDDGEYGDKLILRFSATCDSNDSS